MADDRTPAAFDLRRDAFSDDKKERDSDSAFPSLKQRPAEERVADGGDIREDRDEHRRGARRGDEGGGCAEGEGARGGGEAQRARIELHRRQLEWQEAEEVETHPCGDGRRGDTKDRERAVAAALSIDVAECRRADAERGEGARKAGGE